MIFEWKKALYFTSCDFMLWNSCGNHFQSNNLYYFCRKIWFHWHYTSSEWHRITLCSLKKWFNRNDTEKNSFKFLTEARWSDAIHAHQFDRHALSVRLINETGNLNILMNRMTTWFKMLVVKDEDEWGRKLFVTNTMQKHVAIIYPPFARIQYFPKCQPV